MPLFCDTALAARIERAEAQLTARASEAAHRRAAGGAGFVTPIAGGVASFAEDGSPFNKVAGFGFGGVPSQAELEGIEQAFAACGAPVQIELAHLADPAIGALLTGRGYQLVSFENVLGLALGDQPERVIPAGVEIRQRGQRVRAVARRRGRGQHPPRRAGSSLNRRVPARADREGGA